MVSADLSGMGKASGQPVRWSIMVKMCLLPEVDVGNQWLNLWRFYQMVCQGFLSFARDTVELWLCLICKGCSLQYTSWYPYSFLSNNIGAWWDNTYGCFLDVPVYHGLLLEWWISMTLEWQGQEIAYRHPIHVYRGVPLHEWRCQTHDVGLCHLVVFWRCICRRDQFSASVVKHPVDQLLMISVWECHPEICVVWVPWEGWKWGLRYSGYDSWYGKLIHHLGRL